MKRQIQCCWRRAALLAAIILIVTACSEPASTSVAAVSPEPADTAAPASTSTPIPPTPTSTTAPTATTAPELQQPEEPEPAATPEPEPSPEADHEHVDGESVGIIYHDLFTDISSGWPNGIVFDNFYIGYHEPEFYHVEVHEPNDKAIAVLPDMTFEDVTAEVEVFTDEANTAQSGDFRFGLALRRSGNHYYAFTISPNTKSWQVLKSSPTGLEILEEGTDETIHDFGEVDKLRVDASGPNFTFHINDRPVSQVEDGEYTTGELGFIVETFDSPRAHIHYDSLTVREVSEVDVLYHDLFRDISTGWPNGIVFDNYYIGYHEPEFYHVEVHEPNDKAIAVLPDREFEDVTAEVEVFTDEANTAQSGDFSYGLALRRSGNHYYAFTISPNTKSWRVLKSSPTGLEILDEGADETIHDFGEVDRLRVDANGPIFTFYINDRPVSQVEDGEYTIGDLGFIVETFDSPRAHIHYDSLTVREARVPQAACMVTILVLNLREGPGLSFSPIELLPDGTRLEPLARSSDDLWILVRIEGGDLVGWVASFEPYVSCNFPVTDLPVSS